MLTVSANFLRQIKKGAEVTALSIVKSEGIQARCKSQNTVGKKACLAKYITKVGSLAFRRPLKQIERTNYEKLYARLTSDSDVDRAFVGMTTAMLMSPSFIYRIENPTSAKEELDQYEIASQISYSLTGTPPDLSLIHISEPTRPY